MDLVKKLEALRCYLQAKARFSKDQSEKEASVLYSETVREAIAALRVGVKSDLSALDREELELVVRCQAERIEQLQSAPVAVTVDDAMVERAQSAYRIPPTPEEIERDGPHGACIRRALSAALAAEVG